MMKNRSVKLSIADPCKEDWDGMSPSEKGRFCNSCEKQVVDLSRMTDLEIIQLIDDNPGVKMCGNAKPSQLGRPIQYNMQVVSPILYSNFSLRAILLGASLSALLGLESCSTSNTVTGEFTANERPVEMLRGDVAMIYDHKDEHLISGVVYKNDSTTLTNSKITLFDFKGEEVGKTFSLTDGSFRLDLNWDKQPSYFTVQLEGYNQMTYYLDQVEVLQEMKIMLPVQEPKIMGKVMVSPQEIQSVEGKPEKRRKN